MNEEALEVIMNLYRCLSCASSLPVDGSGHLNTSVGRRGFGNRAVIRYWKHSQLIIQGLLSASCRQFVYTWNHQMRHGRRGKGTRPPLPPKPSGNYHFYFQFYKIFSPHAVPLSAVSWCVAWLSHPAWNSKVYKNNNCGHCEIFSLNNT